MRRKKGRLELTSPDSSNRPALRAHLLEQLANSLSAPLPVATERYVSRAITFPGKATAVVGMRRSGKTTFLHQLRRTRLEQGVLQERLPYINFEDERLAGVTVTDLSALIEEYYRRFPNFRGKETVTWCFDEIQVVSHWERFVRRMLDSEKVEIFLSGSSAALLSREIATALRGRAWEVVIFPFSFEEYLRHHKKEKPDRIDLLSTDERSFLQGALRDYLFCGGFPEAQSLDAETRYRLLLDYVDVAILRDVVERHGVSNVVSLRWLVRHLLSNPGGLFSVEKFYASLKSQGLAVSRDTLHHLISYLEDCFLIHTVWVEGASERRRMVNPRKIYPVDPGFIPVFDRSGKANLGHGLETAVSIELKRQGMEFHYVRTSDGFEVDFFARSPDGTEALIQVSSDLSEDVVKERKVRALLSAANEHPRASLHIITLMPETAGYVPERVQLHDATTWFLVPSPRVNRESRRSRT
ncbi:MAG: ATP-binding protein [Deltaproteobacteria bacterium]|nr:ATP-binding protein [Deltaproteobacteria bacterium]